MVLNPEQIDPTLCFIFLALSYEVSYSPQTSSLLCFLNPTSMGPSKKANHLPLTLRSGRGGSVDFSNSLLNKYLREKDFF
jgi:hypothetical protein